MQNDKTIALDILDFWWQAGPSKWFARNDAFDKAIRDRFATHVDQAIDGGFSEWENAPHSALALILLLDQFPRNLFRGHARAFAGDPRGLAVAAKAVDAGFDQAFPREARTFFYLPFEHAEDMTAQERSVDLFRQLANQDTYFYALLHMDVIRRFGRFPHRNLALGRATTPQEQAFLDDGGFSA